MTALHLLSLTATAAIWGGTLTFIARELRGNAARCVAILAGERA